jgi:6-phosphogluconolactonase
MAENLELFTHDSEDALVRSVVARWGEWLQHRGHSGSSVAISGGRIAGALFAAAARAAGENDHLREALSRTDFFWADERCVPPEHPDSNFGLFRSSGLPQAATIPDHRLHRIWGEWPPSEAAHQASDELRLTLGGVERPVLDLVFLGMGEDGHIASIFPGRPNPADTIYFAVSDSPKPPLERVTLSLEMLERATEVWLVLAGSGKRAVLEEARRGADLPIGQLLRRRKRTRVFADFK